MIVVISVLTILFVAGLACGGGGALAPTPTTMLTPMPTPTPSLTKTECEVDRDALQAALYAYHAEKGEWPTVDGRAGDIVWDKLVPHFLPEIPSTDSKCDWQVDSKPEGGVCLWERC